MAIRAAHERLVLVNGVDLSDHVVEGHRDRHRRSVDITAMGATANAYTKGLGDASISIDFFQDFAAARFTRRCSR
jgi:hypothetical protein